MRLWTFSILLPSRSTLILAQLDGNCLRQVIGLPGQRYRTGNAAAKYILFTYPVQGI